MHKRHAPDLAAWKEPNALTGKELRKRVRVYERVSQEHYERTVAGLVNYTLQSVQQRCRERAAQGKWTCLHRVRTSDGEDQPWAPQGISRLQLWEASQKLEVYFQRQPWPHARVTVLVPDPDDDDTFGMWVDWRVV